MENEIINSVVHLVTPGTGKLVRIICCFAVCINDMFVIFFHVFQKLNFRHIGRVTDFAGILVWFILCFGCILMLVADVLCHVTLKLELLRAMGALERKVV